MCGWTVSCAVTDKGLLGLIHIYSVTSLGINSFLSFQKKAINNSIWTFQISFLGIGALWLTLHCKVIEIKLALEIIINLRYGVNWLLVWFEEVDELCCLKLLMLSNTWSVCDTYNMLILKYISFPELVRC